MIASRSAYVKAPTRQLHINSTPIAVSGNDHIGNINALKLSSMCKSASQAVLSRIQPTVQATR